ncbi:hypothetical protein OG948_01570 [Embleya sp. NBC_00888]|nr:hypothetical protein OG948_01570 [Embleya sp. NBC_00888]
MRVRVRPDPYGAAHTALFGELAFGRECPTVIDAVGHMFADAAAQGTPR